MASTEAIKVNIRVRPLNAREKSSPSCYARFRAVGNGAPALAEYEASGKQKAATRAEFDNGEFSPRGRQSGGGRADYSFFLLLLLLLQLLLLLLLPLPRPLPLVHLPFKSEL